MTDVAWPKRSRPSLRRRLLDTFNDAWTGSPDAPKPAVLRKKRRDAPAPRSVSAERYAVPRDRDSPTASMQRVATSRHARMASEPHSATNAGYGSSSSLSSSDRTSIGRHPEFVVPYELDEPRSGSWAAPEHGQPWSMPSSPKFSPHDTARPHSSSDYYRMQLERDRRDRDLPPLPPDADTSDSDGPRTPPSDDHDYHLLAPGTFAYAVGSEEDHSASADQESYEHGSDDRGNGQTASKRRRLSLPLVLTPNSSDVSKPGRQDSLLARAASLSHATSLKWKNVARRRRGTARESPIVDSVECAI